MATNSVVSEDIWIYNLVEESWVNQMFLVHQAALTGNLRKIEDDRSIRKAFHAIEDRSETIEFKKEIYREMQVRHLIATDITRENADIMLALDPQMFSHEPIGICFECKTPQDFLTEYATISSLITTSSRLIICVECINKVVKFLIEESVAQGHTELVENQFRTHFLIDWIYEPNYYQRDRLMWNFFNIEWLKIVEDVFRRTFLGDRLDTNGIHFFASFNLSALSYEVGREGGDDKW